MRGSAAALAALLLTACGQAEPAERPGAVTVFAAASLREAFTDLGEQFEVATGPGTTVTFSFAGSATLVAQVQQGAPADVVVTADERSIRALAEQVEEPTSLARNALAVVTERGNPKRLATLRDLGRDDVTVVLGGPDVPVGRAARAALAGAGVPVQPVSAEPDVSAVLGKVRLGAADAGIVYVTDLLAAADTVGGFPLPGTVNVYAGAVVRGTARPDAARAFLAFAAGAEGQRVLAAFGFLPP